jgi:Fe-S oxidoreductase
MDDYAYVGEPPMVLPESIDEIHISVTFSWDLAEAERLHGLWSRVAPVKLGGPATGQRGEDFVPGRYLRPGYVITSRGCPSNRCWFCSVPQREGNVVRELPVMDGNNVLDDNLLACSDAHVEKVFRMLLGQKKQGHGILLTGGLEAARLRNWHIEWFKVLRPQRMYFAYDTPDDLPALEEAARLFCEAEYGTRQILNCYGLVGYPGDTMLAAEERMQRIKRLGFTPMAMLYRDESNRQPSLEWRRFQKAWARPAAIFARNRDMRYLL